MTLALALAAGVTLGGGIATPAAAATAATVTVNATNGLGTIPSNGIGLNTAVYDGYMNDATIPGRLKTAGINALRYPGGSYSDIYNWQTQTAVAGGYIASNTSFSQFAATVQAANAGSIVTVNYGSGTPSLAAAWVQAAASDNANVKYWEIGNEIPGNGTYGANWETDSHCRTSLNGSPVTIGSEPSQTYNCGPTEYAQNVLSYIAAMKAVNPGVHVCAVLTTPGFWPDNVTNAEYPQSWNQTVLSKLGAQTDCVIVHYYPVQSGSSPATMLTAPTDIPGIVSTLKSEIQQYAGVNPANVPVLVTETNSTVAQDVQPGALFSADMYMTWLENGAANVDWWDEHNGASGPSIVDGAQDYGDGGMFSSASSSGGVTEPAVDTPFASYYGVEMLTRLGGPGDTMVTSSSSNSLLRTHAVRHGGNLDVLVENEDPSNSYTVNLTYDNFTPSGGATVYTLGNNASTITSATQSSASSVTVAPYTLTVVQIAGSGGTGTTAAGAPGQPTVSNLSSGTSGTTSGSATLTWSPATPGTYPVAGYQVYQTAGGSGALVASPTGTTVNLTGLTDGQSYTYHVVAVDTQGNTSNPSPSVTFTVPSPSAAGCQAQYTTTNSWSGGFQGQVTVTADNSPISGWTVRWTLGSGQSMSQLWNGALTTSGSAVTVRNVSYNESIPASGSTTFGFTANGSPSAPALSCTSP